MSQSRHNWSADSPREFRSASSLKFLRERNLIHRDIKPQNLLLEPSTPADAPIPLGIPLLKIADFGFARSLPNAALAETLCGSP